MDSKIGTNENPRYPTRSPVSEIGNEWDSEDFSRIITPFCYMDRTTHQFSQLIDKDKTGNIIKTILPNDTCSELYFEKIYSIDYDSGTLYIPDWRKDGPRTLVVAERT